MAIHPVKLRSIVALRDMGLLVLSQLPEFQEKSRVIAKRPVEKNLDAQRIAFQFQDIIADGLEDHSMVGIQIYVQSVGLLEVVEDILYQSFNLIRLPLVFSLVEVNVVICCRKKSIDVLLFGIYFHRTILLCNKRRLGPFGLNKQPASADAISISARLLWPPPIFR